MKISFDEKSFRNAIVDVSMEIAKECVLEKFKDKNSEIYKEYVADYAQKNNIDPSKIKLTNPRIEGNGVSCDVVII